MAPFQVPLELDRLNDDGLLRRTINSDGVSQTSSKPGQFDLHEISVHQFDSVSEAECVGPEKMNMRVSRPPMSGVFEMMMLEICDRVGHVHFPRREWT